MADRQKPRSPPFLPLLLQSLPSMHPRLRPIPVLSPTVAGDPLPRFSRFILTPRVIDHHQSRPTAATNPTAPVLLAGDLPTVRNPGTLQLDPSSRLPRSQLHTTTTSCSDLKTRKHFTDCALMAGKGGNFLWEGSQMANLDLGSTDGAPLRMFSFSSIIMTAQTDTWTLDNSITEMACSKGIAITAASTSSDTKKKDDQNSTDELLLPYTPQRRRRVTQMDIIPAVMAYAISSAVSRMHVC
ncbi:hypothetical protein ARMSODRAFT_766800 [Armillaria solidipes]|uniref:Uncharacterized protein n=1 Tax=Armillaria solidipes TaxID=1076256 RepID=A0A2H3ALZ6_9AGAR|nr:hypothetical protein ARMSODRAFT_766800 [Armillaria solidipes]